MNIIIVGCGKVGYTIAKHLSEEAHNIIMIDKKTDAFDKIVESIDVIVVKGNGLTRKTLLDASVKTADIIICVTNSDEANILSCVTAKQLGVKYAIARVRDPEYYAEFNDLSDYLEVDMIINPEQQAALEITRLLRFPSAHEMETFVNGDVELVVFKLYENNPLVGKSVVDGFRKLKIPVLAAVIERDDDAFIPNGQTVLAVGDKISLLGRPRHITEFSWKLGMNVQKIKNVMLIGGGKIAYYLTKYLKSHNISMKIIEIDEKRCQKLSEDLPDTLVINGDGTDEEILNSEMGDIEAIACITDRDEENIIIGLYSKRCGVSKTIVKINHINLNIVDDLDMGSVVCPKNTTAYQIIRYVRGLVNSQHQSNIKAIFNLMDNEKGFIEALEFEVGKGSECVGKEIAKLNIRSGVLIGCMVRKGSIIIPSGASVIEGGDTVILICKDVNITEFDDILGESDIVVTAR